MDRGSDVVALASAYVLRPLSNTARILGADIGRRPKLHNMNEDYGDILVDIRTDLDTCFLGVFIAKRESGSGGHMTGEHMTRERQGGANY
jgi:hypothetical protein